MNIFQNQHFVSKSKIQFSKHKFSDVKLYQNMFLELNIFNLFIVQFTKKSNRLHQFFIFQPSEHQTSSRISYHNWPQRLPPHLPVDQYPPKTSFLSTVQTVVSQPVWELWKVLPQISWRGQEISKTGCVRPESKVRI